MIRATIAEAKGLSKSRCCREALAQLHVTRLSFIECSRGSFETSTRAHARARGKVVDRDRCAVLISSFFKCTFRIKQLIRHAGWTRFEGVSATLRVTRMRTLEVMPEPIVRSRCLSEK